MNKIRFQRTKFSDSTNYFWDICIDEISIREILDSADVTPIGWGVKSESVIALNRLRLKEKSNLYSKQIEILVCSCCGDIGCGSITVAIQEVNGTIVWKNFAFENEYENEIIHEEDILNVGPFIFDRGQYFRSFNSIKI